MDLPVGRNRRDLNATATSGGSTVEVEGPIFDKGTVLQTVVRTEGEWLERRVAVPLLHALDAIVSGKGRESTIRVGALNQLWRRYDTGDFGTGKSGFAVYELARENKPTLTIWLVDSAVVRKTDGSGPQTLMLGRSR